MNAERLKEYDAKCDALQNAAVEAKRLTKIVIDAGRTLERGWERVCIGGIQESNSLASSDAEGKPILSIDGQSWPSAAKLATAFTNYKNARREARQLYDELRVAGASVLPPEENINTGRGP